MSWIDGAVHRAHMQAMGKRPDHVKPPAYLSKSPPVPEPEPLDVAKDAEHDFDGRLSPTRFGDWERKGVAVDF